VVTNEGSGGINEGRRVGEERERREWKRGE
jgi:hypothetical protein